MKTTVTVALAPDTEQDLVQLRAWDARWDTGEPEARLHIDALDSLGLIEAYAAALDANEFCRAELTFETRDAK